MQPSLRMIFLVLLLGGAESCGNGGSADDIGLDLGAPILVGEYLTPELRGQVEQLKASVAREPTNAGNLLGRAKVLWAWANAYALSGRPIDPELPFTIARIRRPLPVQRPRLTCSPACRASVP